MELLKQYRVAVLGEPDAGKSTLVKSLVESLTGRVLSTDTLMKEVHWSDGRDPDGNPDTRTIKCAKVMFKYGDYEWCFYDAPGHLEYSDQIGQAVHDADFILFLIHDSYPKRGSEYMKGVLSEQAERCILYTHSGKTKMELNCGFYDVKSPDFHAFAVDLMDYILKELTKRGSEPHDIESEALELIRENVDPNKRNVMFFSAGKDSALGLSLVEKAGLKDAVEYWFPNSGYDFPEVEQMRLEYEKYFSVKITRFGNSLGRTYERDGAFLMMEAKALSNEAFIEVQNKIEQIDKVLVQYRASDEGVRSKDYHLSERANHTRFSPVFYFSETNVWRYLEKYNVPVCTLYFEGYRSLGDEPVTKPCMASLSTKVEIVEWIENHPNTTERDGRTGQDGNNTMEKVRDIGFF